MIRALILAALLWFPQNAVAPLNTAGVATGCDNVSIQCTYTDVAVPSGPHFYFVVASNSVGFSGPSNRVDVTIPAGTHNATLNWTPSTTPNVSYWIYRGAPPTNLQVITAQ